MKRINNGIVPSIYGIKLPSNGMEFDMVTMGLAGVEFSTELKTVKDLANPKSTAKLRKRIAVDTARTLLSSSKKHFSTEDYKNLGKIVGPKRFSDIGSPIYGTQNGMFNAFNTFRYMLSIKSSTSSKESRIADLKYSGGIPKGDLAQTLYSNVAKKINELIPKVEEEWGITIDSMDDLRNLIYLLFQAFDPIFGSDAIRKSIQLEFLEDIKQIVYDVYEKNRPSSSKFDEIMGNSYRENKFYNSLGDLFYDNIDSIAINLPGTNDYKLIWRDNIEYHFLKKVGNNPVELTVDILHGIIDSSFFLIDNNIHLIDKNDITSAHIDTFGPFVFIHDTSTGANGITAAQNLRFLTSKYEIGFCVKDENGDTINILPNAFLTNEQGLLFESRVSLKNNRFVILSEGEYQSLVNSRMIIVDERFVLKDTYRSIGYKTGDNTELFIQPFEPSCIPSEPFRPIIKDVLREKFIGSFVKSLSSEVHTQLNHDSLEALRKELSGLFTVLRQIEEIYDETSSDTPTSLFPSNLEEWYWFTVQGKDIINNFFQMHGFSDSRPYTQDYVIDVFKVLEPSSQDLDNINIKVPTQSSLKKFYQTLLNLITQKISHEYFSEFNKDLQGQFSSGNDITESDYHLISIMDNILPKIFGYPAFASLVTGLLNIEENLGSYRISFLAPSRKYLGVLFNRFGIKPLNAPNPGGGVYSPSHFMGGHYDGFYFDAFSSILTYGLYRVIKVGSVYKLHTIMPPKNTLEILFSDYSFTLQSQSYYTNRRREFSQFYQETLSLSQSVDSALEQIVSSLSAFQTITIDNFLVRFRFLLSFIPFELNKITFQNFIDYYSLDLQIDGDIIVNNNYNPLAEVGEEGVSLSEQDVSAILLGIKRMFDSVVISIDAYMLAEHFDLDTSSLMRIMFDYGTDAGINFYYSNGIYYNKDKV